MVTIRRLCARGDERQVTEYIDKQWQINICSGVEQELAGLQLDLKLTSGPKKSALELLRKKIEMQNENVVLARGKFQAARKVQSDTKLALTRNSTWICYTYMKEQLSQL